VFPFRSIIAYNSIRTSGAQVHDDAGWECDSHRCPYPYSAYWVRSLHRLLFIASCLISNPLQTRLLRVPRRGEASDGEVPGRGDPGSGHPTRRRDLCHWGEVGLLLMIYLSVPVKSVCDLACRRRRCTATPRCQLLRSVKERLVNYCRQCLWFICFSSVAMPSLPSRCTGTNGICHTAIIMCSALCSYWLLQHSPGKDPHCQDDYIS